MRVLQVYRTYYPECRGGLLEVIRQICIGGRPLGVENRIFALSRKPDSAVTEMDGIKVQWFKLDFELAGCGFSLESLLRFRELAAWADVVHYHFPWPFADLLHLLGRPNRPTVLTYHSDIVKQERLMMIYRPVMRRFLASVDAIVATSPNYLATSPVLQSFAEKTRVIPIGIDPDSYPAADPARLDHWRRTLGDDFFLFVGVIRYYKGLHYLLDAVRGTSHKVAVLGGGPILEELKSFAASNKMENVVFLGELPEKDKVALLQLCRALLLPSHLRSEAFGVSLLEAAMFAKPLVTCEIGTGTSFVNLHEQTGLVVPPEDPIALRQALDRLAESEADCERWGLNAQRRYLENFTARKMAESYLGLYREVMASHRRIISEFPEMQAIKSVIVTGATSQIGVFLLPRLVNQGLAVHALSRRSKDLGVSGCEVIWHEADIANGDVPALQADCLIHLAPLTLLPSVLTKFEHAGLIRVIAFGSTSRFSKLESSDPEERDFALGLAKSEDALADYGVRLGTAWTVFRPTLIYGCGMDKNITIIANFIRRFGFFPLIGDAGGLRQPVHADDLAAACLAVLDNGATFNKAYNLSGGETLSYRQMVERIFAAEGKRPRFLRIPLPLFKVAMEVASLWPPYRHLSGEMAKRMTEDLCFPHDDAMRDFGYAPRGFEPPRRSAL